MYSYFATSLLHLSSKSGTVVSLFWDKNGFVGTCFVLTQQLVYYLPFLLLLFLRLSFFSLANQCTLYFMFQHQLQQLDNDLIIIKTPMPAVKSITAMALINTGSRFEKPDELGVAHFLEHLVFKGTRKYPDRLKLAIKLDSVGASSNAFTSKEYTGFYVTAASKHLPLSLDVLQQLIFAPLLRKVDVIHERSVIKEEIKMHQDSPNDFIAEEYERMAYQGSGLEHPISGSLEAVSQVEAQDLSSFLDQWYGLGNMVLVLAGDAKYLQESDCKTKVERVFARQPASREDHRQEKIKSFLGAEPYSQERLLVVNKETAQAHFVLGWPALKRNDPQRYVLSVLSTVIGGNRSSRLFNVVREQRGLAYYVYSDIDQYHDGGMLGASAGVNVDKVEEGITATLEQYQQLASGEQSVSESELKKAKDYLTGRILLGLEDSRSVAHYYGLKKILLDKIEDPDQVVKQIQAVTFEQVQQLASKIIRPGQVKLAVVGPFSDNKQFKKLLD